MFGLQKREKQTTDVVFPACLGNVSACPLDVQIQAIDLHQRFFSVDVIVTIRTNHRVLIMALSPSGYFFVVYNVRFQPLRAEKTGLMICLKLHILDFYTTLLWIQPCFHLHFHKSYIYYSHNHSCYYCLYLHSSVWDVQFFGLFTGGSEIQTMVACSKRPRWGRQRSSECSGADGEHRAHGRSTGERSDM